MELLVNGLMQLGAQPRSAAGEALRRRAVCAGLSDIGHKNGEFAERFLRYEGIELVGKDLGGDHGRRLQYWPVSGRARQSYIVGGAIDDRDRKTRPAASYGDVELF